MDVLDRADLPFPHSLPEFQRLFPDDAACAAYLEKARWGDGFACPHCGTAGEPFHFENRPGVLRCRKCRQNTGLTVGTVMERSHTPLSCRARRRRGPGVREVRRATSSGEASSLMIRVAGRPRLAGAVAWARSRSLLRAAPEANSVLRLGVEPWRRGLAHPVFELLGVYLKLIERSTFCMRRQRIFQGILVS